MLMHLKPALAALLIYTVTSAVTALNIYISKDHINLYYNSNTDTKVHIVHKRESHVSSNGRLIFANGTELPPFPESVDMVTFTWLSAAEGKVTYGIELQEDMQPSLLLNPTISISDNGLVPEDRSVFDIGIKCASLASGIAQVGVNLSLLYEDGFNIIVPFSIEKQCTVADVTTTTDPNMVQPTEAMHHTVDGSGTKQSEVGSGRASLIDLDVLSPTTTVVTQSSHSNTSIKTLSQFVSSAVKSSHSVIPSISSSRIASESSQVLITTVTSFPRSTVPSINSTVSTNQLSSLLPSSSNAVVPSNSSSDQYASVSIFSSVPHSLVTIAASSALSAGVASSTVKIVNSAIIDSSTVTESSSSLIVPSSLTSLTGSSVTHLMSHNVTPVSPISSNIQLSSSRLISNSSVLSQLFSSQMSSATRESSSLMPATTSDAATPVSSIATTILPSVSSQGLISTHFVSSLQATSRLLPSEASSTQSESSTYIQISSTVIPSTTTPVKVPSVDSSTVQPLRPSEVLSSATATQTIPTSNSVDAVSTITSLSMTSSNIVSSSVLLSSAVVTATNSSASKQSTSVMTKPVAMSTVDIKSTKSRVIDRSKPTNIVAPTSGVVLSSSAAISSHISQSVATIISAIPTSSLSDAVMSTLAANSSTLKSSTSALIIAQTSSKSTPVFSSSQNVGTINTANPTSLSDAIMSTLATNSSTLKSSTSALIIAQTSSKSTPVFSSRQNVGTINTANPTSLSDVVTSTLATSSSTMTSSTVIIIKSASKSTPVSSSSHFVPSSTALSSSLVVNATDTVTSPEDRTNEASLTLIIIVAATTSALITICIMLICVILALTFKHRRKPRRKRPTAEIPIHIKFTSPTPGGAKDKEEENFGPPSIWTSLRWGSVRNLSRPAQRLVQQLAMDRESLEMKETIRKGEYGWLIKARITLGAVNSDALPTHRMVLVKMITGLGLGTKACGSCEEVSEFLDKATLLRGICHPNILTVLGLSSEDHQAPMVTYPYPEIGSLHIFLSSHKHSTSASRLKEPLTPKLLMDFCVQLAEAMKHLECFGIVHPDLQLRTCQLAAGYTLKVGDGALMSDFHPECYHVVYGAQRPVRWSALETLQGGLCSMPSNVWSFGITIWEIITLGEFPYSDVTNRNVLAHVMLGSRLEQPHDCPNELYELMSSCWHTSPRQRPMFIELAKHFKTFARLYSSDDEMGIPNSDSSFFPRQQQQCQENCSTPVAFHYGDQNMSHLLTAQISTSDAVSLSFSALGSTEDLSAKSCTESDNKRQNTLSPVDIPTETSSSIYSPEGPLSPIPDVHISPAPVPYGMEHQRMVPSRVPLRNEPPVNKFLLKANGSRESTPDYRYSMSSDSQYSSSQYSSDMSDNSRQQLLRHKIDSPEKKTASIAEQSRKEKELSSSDYASSMEGGMLSELMASFDQQLDHSSNH